MHQLAKRTCFGEAAIDKSEADQLTLADRILFIDGEAIVLDKPAGLPVDTPRRGGLGSSRYG